MKENFFPAGLLAVTFLLSACVPGFSLDDKAAPKLTLINPVEARTTNKTPNLTFNSSEAGNITYGGACSSARKAAYFGLNTIFFNTLAEGIYTDCSLTVTDVAGNVSAVLEIPDFQIVDKFLGINDTGITLCGDYATATKTAGKINTFNSFATIAKPTAPGSAGTAAGTYTDVVLTNITGTGTGAKATIVTASTPSAIASFNTIVGGSGYVNNTYTDVPLTNVTGTGVNARATIVVSGGAVTSVTINANASGSGYSITAGSNTLSAATSNLGGGSGTGFKVNVATLATVIRVTSVSMASAANAGSGYVVGNQLTAASASIGGVTGFVAVVGSLGTYSNALNCAATGATQTNAGTEAVENDAVPQGQDALYGRDADLAVNDNSDGTAGFSYTKLDSAGNITDGTPACVKDNVTGLVWEIKTDATTPDFRDKDHRYTWYNSSAVNDGNNAGTGDTGAAVGSDNCTNTARCDTEKYVADVNAANICGESADDWRLPTIDELVSLRALYRTAAPSIETTFFPNTMATSVNYWSASPDSSNSANAWVMSASTGALAQVAKSSTTTHVRLVRTGN